MAAKRQRGIALLVFIIVLALTISVYYISSVSVIDIEVDNSENTHLQLKRAKQALLDYAVINWQADALDAGKIGKLPCPDYNINNNEGSQDSNCGGDYTNAIGFFPWRTLGVDIAKDSSGSCFLYVVSPAYKSSPPAALNPDSFGQIRIVDATGAVVQGATPEDRPVAVIIAPGKALSGQVRVFDEDSICGNDYGNIGAYLDNDGTSDNAAVDTVNDNVIDLLVSAYAGSEDWDNVAPLNDRLITITHQEFWQALESTLDASAFEDRMENLTEAVAMCFAAYGANNTDNNLPMPAALDLNGGEYRRNIDYDDSAIFTTAFAGRLPYDVSNANGVTGVTEGRIFSNTFCDAIDLTSTIAINESINFSNDTGSDTGEYFDLWQNWKDHFFYAVSKRFKPDGGGSAAACDPGGSDCVDVNGAKYAAIIFFSGLKQGVQSRYSPPFEADEKDDINNYLENGNESDFPDNSGNGSYDIVGGISNDIMFCIREDMSVVECL